MGKKHLTTQVTPGSHGSIDADPPGPQYAEAATVTLTAVAAAGYEFDHWEGDLSGSQSPASLTMDAHKTVRAVFHAVYGLAVTAQNGSVVKSPDAAQYADGTQVTLTPQPASGYEFDCWQGDLTGSADPATVTMDADKAVTAVFRRVYTLTITTSNGSVAKSPDAAHYTTGTSVELSATPTGGYLFDHWEGDLTGGANPDTVTMDADKAVTAVFVPDYIEDEDSSDDSEADDLDDGPDYDVVQQAGGQKHLYLTVPNYDDDPNSSTAPRTYLQLGAFPDSSADPRYWGDDMLDLVGVPTSSTAYFKDDHRYVNGQTHPDTKYARWDGVIKDDTTDPLTLTSQLRTRGGWRLHTDGNYLSTTRGDRVDVYYGNYKMVVLGRMDIAGGEWGETYWESSGGHTRWATNTQGDLVLVRWNADRSRWRTYEETIKGDLIDRYQGIKEEIYECPRIVTMVGSPDAATTDIPGVAKDPHTQATSDADGAATDHYPPAYAGKWIRPGGRKKERPNVTERTYAKDVSSTTKVTSGMATSATECSDSTLSSLDVDGFDLGDDLDFTTGRPPVGAIVSKKSVATSAEEEVFSYGGRVYEKLEVDSGVTITEETGFAPANASSSLTDAVRVDQYNDLLFCFGKVSSDISHIRKAGGYGGWSFNFSLVGAAIDLSFGVTLTVPNFARKQGDWFNTELGLSWSSNNDITFGLGIEVNVGLKVKATLVHKLEADFTSGKEYCILAFKTEVSDKQLAVVENDTAGVDNDTSGNTKET